MRGNGSSSVLHRPAHVIGADLHEHPRRERKVRVGFDALQHRVSADELHDGELLRLSACGFRSVLMPCRLAAAEPVDELLLAPLELLFVERGCGR